MSLDIPGGGSASACADGSKNLTKTMSNVDPNTLLMRLAGKPVNKKGDSNEDKKDGKDGKGKSKKNGGKNMVQESKERKNSVKHSSNPDRKNSLKFAVMGKSDEKSHEDDDITDWYDEMDESNLESFRDLFNMLDQSNTGIITADNLYEELQRIDSEITYDEVENVLKKVDKDGNGEIDFDEFLHHMTTMGTELFEEDGTLVDEERKKKYSRRQHLFYSAITQFSIKQTLADIEKRFRKQAPHVISHYTAGARLIGLTTRQLERQMKKMQKSAASNDSPYAKPLQFVHMGAKTIVQRKTKKLTIPSMKDKPVSCRDLSTKLDVKEAEDDNPTVANLSQEIKDTMKLFASQGGSIFGKVGDANLIMQLRQKIGSVTAQIRDNDQMAAPMLLVEEEKPLLARSELGFSRKHKSAVGVVKVAVKDEDPRKNNHSKMSSRQLKDKKKKMTGLGWTTPRIQYIDVQLPRIKMKLKSEKPTFNHLHHIRAKAQEATDVYYHNLRQAAIRNAWDHWDRLYADEVLPKKLLDNFRTVYSAYSPHREEEAFVVCPWKPGPFRFLRHIQKAPDRFSLPNSPDFGLSRSSPKSFHRSNDLIVRPLSSLD